MQEKEMTKEMTVSQAARKMGVSLPYVYSLVWAGKLKARKVNRGWRISASAVEARLKARGE